jgi:hypothetical protein
MLGLSAVPKPTHLTSYSRRGKRSANLAFLEALTPRGEALGVYTGKAGFNLDFHAIRHHGDEVPLEEYYVPARSQRTRWVLVFSQGHASTEMVYANAEGARPPTAARQGYRRVPAGYRSRSG